MSIRHFGCWKTCGEWWTFLSCKYPKRLWLGNLGRCYSCLLHCGSFAGHRVKPHRFQDSSSLFDYLTQEYTTISAAECCIVVKWSSLQTVLGPSLLPRSHVDSSCGTAPLWRSGELSLHRSKTKRSFLWLDVTIFALFFISFGMAVLC